MLQIFDGALQEIYNNVSRLKWVTVLGVIGALTSAQSDLANADVALEILGVTKNKILIDSAIGLMVQSNKLPQDALNILASVR